MLPASEILDLYRAERAALDMPSDPFPPFAEWRAAYEAEYRMNHVTNYKKVDVKAAMAEADALVEEAEAELSMMELEEEMEMSETNVSGVVGSAPPIVVDVDAQAPVVAAPEAPAPKAKRKAAKPKARPKAAPKKKASPKKAAKSAKARVARKDNKTALAKAIFERMHGKKERKDVIAAFVEKVGLTPNGASTYYQRFKLGRA